MSKFGSLLTGMGMGAAMTYASHHQEKESDQRRADAIAGKPLTPRTGVLSSAVTDIKKFFTPKSAAAESVTAPAIPDAIPLTPTAQSDQAEFSTAFADQAVSDEPEAFKSSQG